MSVQTITTEIVASIIDDITISYDGVPTLCQKYNTNPKAFYKFLNDYPEYKEKYLQAKKNQVLNLTLEIPEIEARIQKQLDTCEPKKSMAIVQAGRTEIDTRKWLASKLVPKLFGDRLELQTDTVNRQVTVQILPPPISQVNDQANKINGLAV